MRSALLARLWAATQPGWSSTSLFKLAIQYFEKSCSDPTCFNDLRPILPHLKPEETSTFLVTIQEFVAKGISEGSLRHQFTASVNEARLQYLLKVSAPEAQSAEETKFYLHKCLEIIRSSGQSRDNISEACLLAAVGCLHLAFQKKPGEPNMQYLIYAAYLLGSLGTDMQYPAGQLLSAKVHLYICVNAVAYAGYHNLKIKNVVVDSLGYLMYSRISLQLPLGIAVGVKDSMADELSDVLTKTYTDNVNGEWKRNPVKRWKKGLPQPDALLDIADQETKLDQSLTRAVLRVENRRCHRIAGSKYEDNDPRK
jgi:hypothetical protein